MSPEYDDTDEPRFRTAPGTFPTANVPVWVTMHPDCDAGCLAVAQFITAYRNTADGTLPFVERSTVMKRFSKGKDWLDRRTGVLERIGFLTRIAVYRDAITGERTIETHADDGTANRQTSNDWMIHDQPPAGDAHPHPIQSSEFGKPEHVDKRIRERARLTEIAKREGGGAPQRPGHEQEKQRFSQVVPRALHSAWGGRSTAPGGGAPQRPELELRELEPHQPTNAGAHTPDDGHGEASMVGWSTPSNEEHPAESAGARFLSRLAFDDGTSFAAHAVPTLAGHVDQLLISGWTEDGITARITDSTGVGKVANWAGFARRKLADLQPLPAKTIAGGLPAWCGECEDGPRVTRDGKKCRACHPRYARASA